MGECAFCEIVAGREEATRVYEDDRVLAFLDVHPVNDGHLLIVPKQHAALINELDDETIAALFIAAQKLNTALRTSGLKCEGVNYFLADGEAAFQEIFHIHVHLIPRYQGDGFGFTFPEHYGRRPTQAELNAVGEKIINEL